MMLAARGAFLAARRKRKLTAKSYVQDGLIAMWDGIENAGWGVHDSSAQGWINLVNGQFCPFSNSSHSDLDTKGSFGNNRYESGNGGGVNIGTYHVLSVEIVVSRFSGQYMIVTPDVNTGGGFTSPMNILFVTGVGYVPNGRNYGNRVVFSDYTIPHTVSFTREQETDLGAITYGDGVVSTGKLYNDYCGVSKGFIACDYNRKRWTNLHCYSLRLYSRALTAEEIAANYAVDKARFNLPDAT